MRRSARGKEKSHFFSMKNREVIKDKNKEEKRQMINKANIKFFFNKLRCTRNNALTLEQEKKIRASCSY